MRALVALLGLTTISLLVSSRGGKYGFVYANRHRAYRGIRRSGHDKRSAAMISNAGRTHAQRSAMSRKAARTRKRRGR